MADQDHELGLYGKFNVTRADGSSGPGEKHENCEYFVLDLIHDPHALPALRVYATFCAADYPALAKDLHAKCDRMAEEVGSDEGPVGLGPPRP